MTFKYAPIHKWKKQARSAFYNILSQLFVIFFMLYVNSEVTEVIAYVSFVVIVSSVFYMLYSLNMPQRDYIRLEEDYFSVHRGFLDSRKKVSYRDVTQMSRVHEVLSIRTSNGDGEDIYTNQLSDYDLPQLLQILEKRTGIRIGGIDGAKEEVEQRG
ncbi:hypothetical protein H0266_02230 [Halobacillus locisalis]|uniref:Uncharacterized protein n=1 Tax=Halobacillus locisalis TaxID=220753 RepID=A0A838CNS3_9BACI|nr:hypothetical protein [Halobacillus locisalis]MBA2173707.1 hypothetical protein [Halobacillus locisalis]